MKEIRELYGQTWSLYGGSKSCLFGGILSIFIALWLGVASYGLVLAMFAFYLVFHAGIRYRIMTVKMEGFTDQIRVALLIRGARFLFFYFGFTLVHLALYVYLVYFQQASGVTQ